MRGEGTGVERTREAHALWAAAFAEGQVHWTLYGGLALSASAQPQVSLVRRRFRLTGAGVVHQPDRFPFRATLGLSYEFALGR